MDINNSLVVGAGALIVGIIIGYSMSGSGEELAEQGLARTHELSEKVDALSSSLGGLGERVGGIEGAVAALGTAQSDGLQGLTSRIDAMGQSVSGTVQELGGGVTDAVRTQFDALKGQIAAFGAAGVGGASGAGAGGSGDATAAAAPTEALSGKALSPGQTAVLTEGKLHVFLSSADAGSGVARVAINGQTLVPLEVGKTHDADGCAVTLTGFDADGVAMIDGGC